jgi:hypothetical protein
LMPMFESSASSDPLTSVSVFRGTQASPDRHHRL